MSGKTKAISITILVILIPICIVIGIKLSDYSNTVNSNLQKLTECNQNPRYNISYYNDVSGKGTYHAVYIYDYNLNEYVCAFVSEGTTFMRVTKDLQNTIKIADAWLKALEMIFICLAFALLIISIIPSEEYSLKCEAEAKEKELISKEIAAIVKKRKIEAEQYEHKCDPYFELKEIKSTGLYEKVMRVCPHCGGTLKVDYNDHNHIKCFYCGSEFWTK